MKLKSMIKKILITAFTIGALFAVSTPVEATEIGSGVGGPPTQNTGRGRWREIVGKQGTSQAWNRFLANRGVYGWMSESQFARDVVDPMRSGGQKLSTICRSSEVIFYYSYSDSLRWSPVGAGTNRVAWIYTTNSGGTTTNVANRSAVTKHYWREFLKHPTESKNWSRGDVVIVCTSNLPVYEELVERKGKPQKETRTIRSEETISGDISYYLKASPVRRQDYNSYSSAKKNEWNGKHRIQQSPTVKTEFGKFLDKNPWSSVKSTNDWNTWKKGAQAAINKGKSNPQINFNNNILEALKDGGIYTIMESGQTESFTAPFTQKQERTRQVYETVNKATGKVVKRRYGSWSSWKNVGAKELQRVTRNPQPIPPRYYQILTVKCNLDEYQAALKASGGSKLAVANGEAMGGIVTKPISNPNNLPFGNPNHSNAALRKTAYDRFYNQITSCEANFACHVEPQPGAANGSGNNLLSSNGSASVRYDGKIERSNEFTFFRDNEGGDDRTVMPNIWYAKSKGSHDMTIDSRGLAKRTKVSVNSDGTPKLGIVTVNMKNPNGSQIGKIDSTRVINGHVAKLEFMSEWASEEGKPTKIHLDWVYEGGLSSRIPVSVNGAGVIKTTDSTAPIFVGCKMQNETSKPQKAEVTLTASDAYKQVSFSNSRSTISVLFNRAVSSQ